jgi:spermidine synthase
LDSGELLTTIRKEHQVAHRLLTPELELAGPPPLETISRRRARLIRGTSRREKATLALFTITLFTSSSLLFLIQPMFAKMVLPLLGGTPAVWNTSMVFFQAALLLGYAYSHFGVNRLGLRRQALIHIAIVIGPLLLLPIAVPDGWTPPSEGTPILWLLLLLTVSLGLPFFAVSTTAPLLQKWFANTGHPAGKDPYFLYGASNMGSMLALLSYPALMEPRLALASQSRFWMVGYLALATGVSACAAMVLRASRRGITEPEASRDVADEVNLGPVTAIRRLKWIAFAFAPSSFMLAVTTHLSTDIAAIPLLWVIPLALYLITFILVFSPRPVSPRWPARLQPAVVIVLVMFMLSGGANLPKPLLIGLPLLAFFISALVCHAQLAADRPSTRHITEFYLWMAVGGVLGGIFNALVAPVVFNRIYEYPMAIVLGCMLAPALSSKTFRSLSYRKRLKRLILPAGVIALGVALISAKGLLVVGGSALGLAVALMISALLIHRPMSFGAAIGAVIIAATATLGDGSRVLYTGRTFFGVHRVLDDGSFHRFRHGTTLHGLQSTDSARRLEPLSYYHTEGPIGQVLQELPSADAAHIGVVGLGTGSLACYGNPGQDWVFWEIDPAVESIARDPKLFTFLEACPGEHRVVLGDARLTMVGTPDDSLGVLVLDAFTSDAIPVHLMTREAFELYFSKLSNDGVLAMHISNRYLDLEPVVAAIAKDLGVKALIRRDGQMEDKLALGKGGSNWVVLARHEAALQPLRDDARWAAPVVKPGSRVWTDDFSDVFSVFIWR